MAAPNPVERTLLQMSVATDTINAVDPVNGPRFSAYQPMTVIATDHDSDQPAGTIEERAVFKSARVGEPWIKNDNVVASVIFQQAETPTAVPTDVTVLYPNWDYTTF